MTIIILDFIERFLHTTVVLSVDGLTKSSQQHAEVIVILHMLPKLRQRKVK